GVVRIWIRKRREVHVTRQLRLENAKAGRAGIHQDVVDGRARAAVWCAYRHTDVGDVEGRQRDAARAVTHCQRYYIGATGREIMGTRSGVGAGRTTATATATATAAAGE